MDDGFATCASAPSALTQQAKATAGGRSGLGPPAPVPEETGSLWAVELSAVIVKSAKKARLPVGITSPKTAILPPLEREIKGRRPVVEMLHPDASPQIVRVIQRPLLAKPGTPTAATCKILSTPPVFRTPDSETLASAAPPTSALSSRTPVLAEVKRDQPLILSLAAPASAGAAKLTATTGYVSGPERHRASERAPDAPLSTIEAPTFAPGSLLDSVLRKPLAERRRRRPHKPRALKLLTVGREELERKVGGREGGRARVIGAGGVPGSCRTRLPSRSLPVSPLRALSPPPLIWQETEKRLGKVVSKTHRLYHTSFAMMLGIYTSVSSMGGGGNGGSGGGRAPRLLLDDFFEVREDARLGALLCVRPPPCPRLLSPFRRASLSSRRLGAIILCPIP